GNRQPRNENRERVAESTRHGVASRDTVQLTIGRPDPYERARLVAVDGQLGRRTQEVDDLRRELASRRRLAPSGGTRDASGYSRRDDSSEDKPRGEHRARRRQEGCGRP